MQKTASYDQRLKYKMQPLEFNARNLLECTFHAMGLFMVMGYRISIFLLTVILDMSDMEMK